MKETAPFATQYDGHEYSGSRRTNKKDDKVEDHPCYYSEDEDDIFDEHEVMLAHKVAHACSVNKFRPIAILSVFLKLYSMVLPELCGLSDIGVSHYQAAFRKGHQPH